MVSVCVCGVGEGGDQNCNNSVLQDEQDVILVGFRMEIGFHDFLLGDSLAKPTTCLQSLQLGFLEIQGLDLDTTKIDAIFFVEIRLCSTFKNP